MCGTAAADSSLLTVTRTNSDPARASALTCATVPSISAVSVLVMDCTTMGDAPPMGTEPTLTVCEWRRDRMPALYPDSPGKAGTRGAPPYPRGLNAAGVATVGAVVNG